MGELVDFEAWRRTRQGGDVGDPGIRRLEIAVSRLDREASARLDRKGRLEPGVETELLAILGAIASDLIEDAALRAERLARRLGRGAG